MVALLTAPVNLIVDFLFVEVISAPTVQSLKKESSSHFTSSAFGQVLRRASSAVSRVSVASKNTLRKLRRESESISDNWIDMIATTRVIPPRTREAHEEAMECANDVIEVAKSRQDRRSTLMKSKHEEFARSHKSDRSRRHQTPQASKGPPSSSSSRSSQRTRKSSWLMKSVGGVGNADKDEQQQQQQKQDDAEMASLFQQLTYDIDQQRKLLKRSQQDVFDNLWG